MVDPSEDPKQPDERISDGPRMPEQEGGVDPSEKPDSTSPHEPFQLRDEPLPPTPERRFITAYGSEQAQGAPGPTTSPKNRPTVQPQQPAKRKWSPKQLLNPKEYLRAIKEISTVIRTGKKVVSLVWNEAKGQILTSAGLSAAQSLGPTLQGGAIALSISAVQSGNPVLGTLALATIIGSNLIQNTVGRRSLAVGTELNNACMKAIERKLLQSVAILPGESTDKKEVQEQIGLAKDQGGQVLGFIQHVVSTGATAVALIASSAAVFSVSPIASAVTLATGIPLLLTAKERQRIWHEYHQDVMGPGRSFWIRRTGLLTPRRLKEAQMVGATEEISERTIEQLDKMNDETYSAVKKSLHVDLYPAVAQIVTTGGVLGYCLNLTMNGDLSLAAFSFMTGAIYGLSSTIASFSGSIGAQVEAAEKLEPLFSVFREGDRQREAEEQRTNVIDWSSPPRIEFRNVSLYYEGKEDPALEDVSFVIEPGESVLLVGKNGAGKSSLMKLLSGIYSPTNGQILINGVDLATISRDNWHEGFGILPQDVTLFDSFTVRENLELGRSSTVRGKPIEEILEKFGIESMVGGDAPLQRVVGEGFQNSYEPSGGQKRLLGLARTEVSDPKLVIYDEPTANLDGDVAQTVTRDILDVAKGRTVILVTHDYLRGIDCDKVVEMKKGGEIAAIGNPAEIIAREDSLFGRQALEAEQLAKRLERMREESRKNRSGDETE